jgi:hypothetical protein
MELKQFISKSLKSDLFELAMLFGWARSVGTIKKLAVSGTAAEQPRQLERSRIALLARGSLNANRCQPH